MTDDSMVFAFAQFGEVARVHLARDADTKKLRGCASFTHTHTHTQSSAGAPH